MKKIIFLFLISPIISFAQTGQNCGDAIELFPSEQCSGIEFISSSTFMWFKFTAQSENVQVNLTTKKYGLDLPHIHRIEFYQGSCSNNEMKIRDELPFIDSIDRISLDAIAYGLEPGEVYYIKAERTPYIGNCEKENCTHNGSTDPATFSICVRNLIYTPFLFSTSEMANPNYSYEENRGQIFDLNDETVSDIRFFSKNTVPQTFIGERATSFLWSKIDSISSTTDTIHRVDMTFEHSGIPELYKSEKRPEYVNYYGTINYTII